MVIGDIERKIKCKNVVLLFMKCFYVLGLWF